MTTKQRVYNFAAGPACVPQEALLEAQRDLLDYQGCGRSVMELSHRGKEYTKIHAEAKANLKELLKIPDNYKIIFVQGGGAAQFAAIPMNLCATKEDIGDYVITGSWSKQAAQEAADYCKVNIVATNESSKFTTIPPRDQWKLSPNASFLHFCENETIHGVAFVSPPSDVTTTVPLVCDMSSSFLSRPVDVSKYGVIYAGAQKNAGIAGVTIVIIREDLLARSKPEIPSVINYKKKCDTDSLDNTPPVFNIYMTGLVLKWLKGQGGLEAMAKLNHKKAELIYNVIDASNGFYTCPTSRTSRSQINIPIRIRGGEGGGGGGRGGGGGGGGGREGLEETFLSEAERDVVPLVELKGHRSVGGLRVSLYNAMGMEGTEALARFMQDFQQRHS